MIATQNQSVKHGPERATEITPNTSRGELAQQWLPSRSITHQPKSGLNPLADAAAYLFSIMGKLKQTTSPRNLNKLQKELIQEINTFQEMVQTLGYNSEYLLVCRYALCAAFDDIITNTAWGGQGQWDTYNLLSAFKQDAQHQDRFFVILDRLIKNPTLYIDLMEFMYICLSLGFKGHYRNTEYNHYQLEQITETLYQHIRAYRGSFSKTLSPTPLKTARSTPPAPEEKASIAFPMLVTAIVMLLIFLSLGYLLDTLSNDIYQDLLQPRNSIAHETV